MEKFNDSTESPKIPTYEPIPNNLTPEQALELHNEHREILLMQDADEIMRQLPKGETMNGKLHAIRELSSALHNLTNRYGTEGRISETYSDDSWQLPLREALAELDFKC